MSLQGQDTEGTDDSSSCSTLFFLSYFHRRSSVYLSLSLVFIAIRTKVNKWKNTYLIEQNSNQTLRKEEFHQFDTNENVPPSDWIRHNLM